MWKRERRVAECGWDRESVEEEGEEVVVGWGGGKSYVSLGWICACLFHKEVEGKERG